MGKRSKNKAPAVESADFKYTLHLIDTKTPFEVIVPRHTVSDESQLSQETHPHAVYIAKALNEMNKNKSPDLALYQDIKLQPGDIQFDTSAFQNAGPDAQPINLEPTAYFRFALGYDKRLQKEINRGNHLEDQVTELKNKNKKLKKAVEENTNLNAQAQTLTLHEDSLENTEAAQSNGPLGELTKTMALMKARMQKLGAQFETQKAQSEAQTDEFKAELKAQKKEFNQKFEMLIVQHTNIKDDLEEQKKDFNRKLELQQQVNDELKGGIKELAMGLNAYDARSKELAMRLNAYDVRSQELATRLNTFEVVESKPELAMKLSAADVESKGLWAKLADHVRLLEEHTAAIKALVHKV